MAEKQVDTSSWETFKFKLVLLGDASVGKSCIAVRFVRGDFFEYQEPTIGAAFMTQTIPVLAKQAIVKFEIWDTAGQERYKSLAPMYYRGAAVAVIVYDVTSTASYDGARAWVAELERNQGPDKKEKMIIALLGNKVDLGEADDRQVERATAEAFAREKGLLFKETSAKTGQGISEIFNEMASSLELQKKKGEPDGISITQSKQAGGGGCCGR
jgi:small GTP-binding protein